MNYVAAYDLKTSSTIDIYYTSGNGEYKFIIGLTCPRSKITRKTSLKNYPRWLGFDRMIIDLEWIQRQYKTVKQLHTENTAKFLFNELL